MVGVAMKSTMACGSSIVGRRHAARPSALVGRWKKYNALNSQI
jgi:hypothetical protein